MRQLREYQDIAIDFLLTNPRANLHAGMGLGKTASVLHVLRRLEYSEPALCIGPLRVARRVWSSESELWPELAGFKVAPITGTEGEREEALKQRAHLHTINYENLPWLLERYGERWPFRMVVPDESTRLKGYRTRQGTKRSGLLGKVAHRCVDRWINLTGTPAPNGLMDLWGQHWFVDGGRALGTSFEAFKQRWFYTQPKGDTKFSQWLPFRHSQDEIVALMKPTTLTIDAKDWFDVADPIVNDIYVEMPETAMREYKRMERHFFAELERGTVTAATAGAKSQKLLQMASGAAYHEDGKTWSHVHDAKIPALESIIEEAAGMPVLVINQFKHEVERLQKHFPHIRHIKASDKTFEDDWNAGKVPLAVGHPASFGHGLSLQHGGNIVVFYGQTWDLEHYLQALERIGPIRQMQSGYDRPVFLYHILARGTVDEDVMWRRKNKADLGETFKNAMKQRG